MANIEEAIRPSETVQEKSEDHNVVKSTVSEESKKEVSTEVASEPAIPKDNSQVIDLSNIDLSTAADMLDLTSGDISINLDESDDKAAQNTQEQSTKDDLGLGDDLISSLSDDINLNVTDEQKPVTTEQKPVVKAEPPSAPKPAEVTQQTVAAKPQAAANANL